MFNPTTIRHSFKYVSDNEPVSTSYGNEELTGSLLEEYSPTNGSYMPHDPPEDDLEDPFALNDYTLPIPRAPANICFAYSHTGNTFREISTNITNQLNDNA